MQNYRDSTWSKPLRNLADELGLSDVGIATICKRLDVPRTPQGHWARIQHGKDSLRPPLPPAPSRAHEHIGLPDEPIKTPVVARPAAPKIPIGRDRSHPAVNELSGLLTTDFRFNGVRVVRYDGQATLRISSAQEARAMRILSALCRCLSEHGHAISVVRLQRDERRHALVVGNGAASFRISLLEKLKPTPHVPTKEEKARVWLTQRQIDIVPTGKLVLDFLDLHGYANHGSWNEGRQPLEEQLGDAAARVPEIIAELVREKQLQAAAMKAEREDRERLERERAREAQREEHLAALIEDLDDMVDRWSHAEHLREFIRAAKPAILGLPGNRIGRQAWLQWASTYADSIDPLNAPERIAKQLTT